MSMEVAPVGSKRQRGRHRRPVLRRNRLSHVGSWLQKLRVPASPVVVQPTSHRVSGSSIALFATPAAATSRALAAVTSAPPVDPRSWLPVPQQRTGGDR